MIGGGSWGCAFALLLRERGHAVTLACRDAEQARELAETGRNPRYLTFADLSGIAATTIAEAPVEAAELVVLAVPSRAFGEVVGGAPGRRARAEPDEGARPGDRRAPLHARPRPPGRRPLGPELRRGDRRAGCRPRR